MIASLTLFLNARPLNKFPDNTERDHKAWKNSRPFHFQLILSDSSPVLYHACSLPITNYISHGGLRRRAIIYNDDDNSDGRDAAYDSL